MKLANIIESILFVAGNAVEENDIREKLQLTEIEFSQAIEILEKKYSVETSSTY